MCIRDREIAVHADIEDHEQSIYFPGIGTTAKDKADGDQEAVATKEVTIIDTCLLYTSGKKFPTQKSSLLLKRWIWL